MLLAAFLWLPLLQSCDPPGKPKAENAQAENRENIADFATLYNGNCAGCHGTDGKYGGARTLNDPLYLALLPRDTLKQILVYGRPGTQMPAWSKQQGGPLTDNQIDILVNGIYSAWSKPSQYQGQTLLPYAGDISTANVLHGKQLFAKDCFMCHGKGAAVGSVTEASYESLASNQYLRTSILAGRSDLGMPNYRTLNRGKPLEDGDVTDLVAYLASYRPPEVDAQMKAAQAGMKNGGQVVSGSGQHENENGTGHEGSMTKGNEGSGRGPGSPRDNSKGRTEGNKGKGSGSQQGVK